MMLRKTAEVEFDLTESDLLAIIHELSPPTRLYLLRVLAGYAAADVGEVKAVFPNADCGPVVQALERIADVLKGEEPQP